MNQTEYEYLLDKMRIISKYKTSDNEEDNAASFFECKTIARESIMYLGEEFREDIDSGKQLTLSLYQQLYVDLKRCLNKNYRISESDAKEILETLTKSFKDYYSDNE